MRELSLKELDQVYGAFGLPGAVWGGATAGLGYLGNASTSGSFSAAGFATTVGFGALGGAFGSGYVNAASYAVPRISYLGGMAVGAISES